MIIISCCFSIWMRIIIFMWLLGNLYLFHLDFGLYICIKLLVMLQCQILSVKKQALSFIAWPWFIITNSFWKKILIHSNIQIRIIFLLPIVNSLLIIHSLSFLHVFLSSLVKLERLTLALLSPRSSDQITVIVNDRHLAVCPTSCVGLQTDRQQDSLVG